MALEPGTRLGPYQIVELIGKGGMGEVYRARDTRLDRDVAVKVLPGELSADASFRRRFEREARTISRLQHPNVCTLYDVGSSEGADYLVMEYLEGETLESRTDRGPLPPDDVLRVGAQIAAALAAAHEEGVVHRDLKPGNVMLTKRGVKVLDFGLAREAEGAGEAVDTRAATIPAITREDTLVGTLPYMAPEQLEGARADRRSDVWALGCILYEMATGRRAFSATSQVALIASILSEPSPLPSAVQPRFPRALDDVIGRCLAKRPERRWQSAGAVASELAALGGRSRPPGSGGRFDTAQAEETETADRQAANRSSAGVYTRPAVAVLAFENLSPNPEQEYFSDGISEDLIARLSAWRAFPVIARNSTFAFKGRSVDVKEVGRELEARYVIEGSVRKAGDRIRLSAQLIDAVSGHQIWADSYDRVLEDVFALQDELSQAIVGALHPELVRAEGERAARLEPAELDAWELTLRGLWYYHQFRNKTRPEARRCFEEALRLDKRLVLAHYGLAMVYHADLLSGLAEERSETIEKMLAAARRAMAIDDRDPHALVAMGSAYNLAGEPEKMLAPIELAVEIDPSSAMGHEMLGAYLVQAGRADEGIHHLELALGLSPKDPHSVAALSNIALAHFVAERYAEAIEWAQRTLDKRPAWATAARIKAASLACLGRSQEAGSALEEAMRLQPYFRLEHLDTIFASADPEFIRRYKEALRRAGLEK